MVGRLAFSRRRFPTPGPGGQHGTSLHAVIKSCADARDGSRTEHWMALIFQAGFEADTIICNTVMKACADAQECDQIGVLDVMM